jgi:hypothetical protein
MLLPFSVRVSMNKNNSCNIHPDLLQTEPGINFGAKELKFYIYGFNNAPIRKYKILSPQLA